MTPLTLQKYISGFQIREPEDTNKGTGADGANKRLGASPSIKSVTCFQASRIGGEVRFSVTNPAEALQYAIETRARRQKFVRPEQFSALSN